MVERSLGTRRNGKLYGELCVGSCTPRMECGKIFVNTFLFGSKWLKLTVPNRYLLRRKLLAFVSKVTVCRLPTCHRCHLLQHLFTRFGNIIKTTLCQLLHITDSQSEQIVKSVNVSRNHRLNFIRYYFKQIFRKLACITYFAGTKFRDFYILVYLKKGLEQGIETNVSTVCLFREFFKKTCEI